MKGWRYESARHSLAARGVRTSRRYNAESKKTFMESLFEASRQRRKTLVGLGTKEQEDAGKILKERAVARLKPEQRASAELQILEVQRSRQAMNRDIVEKAYPKLSAVEIGKLTADASEEELTKNALVRFNMDARERRDVLDKYRFAYGDDYTKLRGKLTDVIEKTQPEDTRTWAE